MGWVLSLKRKSQVPKKTCPQAALTPLDLCRVCVSWFALVMTRSQISLNNRIGDSTTDCTRRTLPGVGVPKFSSALPNTQMERQMCWQY